MFINTNTYSFHGQVKWGLVAMNKSTWVTHAIATCEDCDFVEEDWTKARALGARHARTKHHKVVVQVGLHLEYDGRAP
jgi:hypothetical protein